MVRLTWLGVAAWVGNSQKLAPPGTPRVLNSEAVPGGYVDKQKGIYGILLLGSTRDRADHALSDCGPAGLGCVEPAWSLLVSS